MSATPTELICRTCVHFDITSCCDKPKCEMSNFDTQGYDENWTDEEVIQEMKNDCDDYEEIKQ